MGMFINTIFFVPRLLLRERFHGAVLGILFAIVIGSVFAFVFTKAMSQYPGQGISEIFRQRMPSWIRVPFLLFLGCMWGTAGCIIILAFSNITLRFLSPETDPTVLLLCYCGICMWTATFRPRAVLHVAEFVIILNLPFVLYIMYKSLTNPLFDWNEVKVLSDYVWRMPSWNVLSAATYPFSSYINLALYNRMYKSTKVTHLWLIPLIGTFVLLVSFVVPIGLLGVDAVSDYLYVWITATDSLRMEFGFIERVSYLFLFIYIGFSLLFVTVSWNVGSLLLRDAVGKREIRVRNLKIPLTWLICGGFALVTFLIAVKTNDKTLIRVVSQWQSLRFAAEFLLVAVVGWMGWRQKHAG
jgi:hypothetical protein